MENRLGFALVVFASIFIPHLVHANEDGFISLDCGLSPEDSPYLETDLTFKSDAGYIDSGESWRVQQGYGESYIRSTMLLRSFPMGERNCYTLNIMNDTDYLIRATFLYGNYDDQNKNPSFDIYIGPNKWKSIVIEDPGELRDAEIIHTSTSKYLHVCLVKTGTTTPFISSLELRPMSKATYFYQNGQSLMTFFRRYLSKSEKIIRYKKDTYDRIWNPYFQADWTQLSNPRASESAYGLPQDAANTAATPKNGSQPLTISWSFDENPDLEFYAHLTFTQIQPLKSNEIREFNFILNGQPIDEPFVVENRMIIGTKILSDEICLEGKCKLSLVRTRRSTLPPYLNAIEVYTIANFKQLESHEADVEAIKKIKATYNLRRISWQGDPCAPKEYIWKGLRCDDKNTSERPRIISLNLSSSGLTGEISSDIYNLNQLTELDLSNNNLTGGVPEFLSRMNSLLEINLGGNKLTGSVPNALLGKKKDGMLKFNFDGNPNLCAEDSCNPKDSYNPKRSSILVPAVAASVTVFVLIIVAVAIFFILKRKKQRVSKGSLATKVMDDEADGQSDSSMATKDRRFSYSEVTRMTNNFENVLGQGAYGVVYHGYLNDTEQVAVKMLSQSSAQGFKQYKAEVELLLRVHHKNLVSLAGYCDEIDNLALIYEYMPNGDLNKHLSGKHGRLVVSWASRLRIAMEAAQGLEYLHDGCKPPMVHRDVKPTNILLDENHQTKLADFGLSRSFPEEGETHVSTVVAGTPGYLDPEYYMTNWLTEKSDVYSFGVVLLEILTNRSVIDRSRERPHISEWVALMLTKGDIKAIMDPKLGGGFEMNTAWKVVELAMSCVSPSSSGRPAMAQVVTELKECLAAENARTGESQEMDSRSSIELNMSFDTEAAPRPR